MVLDRSLHDRGERRAGRHGLRAVVDDETWLHHLRAGDYSQWFRERIKDPTLAEEAAAVERDPSLSAVQSRAKLREVVERHYTLPTGPPLPMPGTDAAPKHE